MADRRLVQEQTSLQTPKLQWLGQAGYLLQSPSGLRIAIDPYLSDSVAKMIPALTRVYPPPVQPQDLLVDILLCTHDHQDHFDPETIQALPNKERITFVGPRNCCRHFAEVGIPAERICRLDVGETILIGDVNIRATWTVPLDEATLDGVGYLLDFAKGVSVYHTGDTDFDDTLLYLTDYDIDVVLTCINGKFRNLDCQKAAGLVKALQPLVAIPNHYDLFADNKADPQEFVAAVQTLGCNVPVRILQVMELLDMGAIGR